MSLDPILWALKDAPVADSLERLVLVTLAERCARADGCTSFPSRDTLAATVLADPKTVQRVLKRLEGRGLIARGDQSAARYLRADRRPVVYDLLIPYSWFPNPERMNAERQQAGLAPLTPQDRPDIAPPPGRKQRSDAGKPRSQQPAERGDCESPREESHGGTTSPARGDCESRTGGLEDPRTSPMNHPVEPPPAPAAPQPATPAAAVVPQQGGGGDAPLEEQRAAAFVDTLPYRGQLPTRTGRADLITATVAALRAGWTETTLRRQLTEGTSTAQSLPAVYRHRLGDLPDPAAAAADRAADATPTPPAYRPEPPRPVVPAREGAAAVRAAMRARCADRRWGVDKRSDVQI